MAEGKSKTGVVKKRASKREKKDWIAAYIFIAPVTLGLLVFYIWPFIQNIWFSFNEVTINEQISNFAQTYPTNLKASSNEALLFMRRYRFANCSCFSCCFKDAYPSSNVQ